MAGSNKRPLALAGKILLLFGMAAGAYLVLLFFCGRYYDKDSKQYVAAQIDKMKNLEATPSPRIVFIGGSNLAFGLDSAQVRQAFGMPAINMGLHAGLGTKYMLDSARPLLRKGDVVIFLPEYSSFLGDDIGGDSILLELFGVTHDLRLLPLLKPSMLLESNGLIVSWRPGATTEEPPYNRAGFNREGDMVGHLAMPPKPVAIDTMTMNINQRAINFLANYTRDCNKDGIKTLVLFPCYRRTNFERNREVILKIESALRQGLPALAPETPEDFVFDDKYFFDTKYHLTAEGRRLRTDKVIAAISSTLHIPRH
ncbi:MAG: hypothetical protein NTX50_13415 [Candidatus Sumerlaeota bacterium]|nr:hypothetical protein [Candidatus Sumerlaeota bacterium]